MNRIIRLLFIVFSCAAFIHCQYCTSNHPDQPNILWITIEDLTSMIGCFGDSMAVTPTIDQLASHGVKFTNAYASGSWCENFWNNLVESLTNTSLYINQSTIL